jgi:hypothetical protein
VLFTSQSYVRQSQPVISPNFAAGLSSGPEEEPTTTPSQDSRVSSSDAGTLCLTIARCAQRELHARPVTWQLLGSFHAAEAAVALTCHCLMLNRRPQQ